MDKRIRTIKVKFPFLENHMDIDNLNSTVDQPEVVDIYRTPHPGTADNTFISYGHGAFTKAIFWA